MCLQWTTPLQLHGIGQYATDAYFIFCRGLWQQVISLTHPQRDLCKLPGTAGLLRRRYCPCWHSAELPSMCACNPRLLRCWAPSNQLLCMSLITHVAAAPGQLVHICPVMRPRGSRSALQTRTCESTTTGWRKQAGRETVWRGSLAILSCSCRSWTRCQQASLPVVPGRQADWQRASPGCLRLLCLSIWTVSTDGCHIKARSTYDRATPAADIMQQLAELLPGQSL